ncbi:hypothetical protein ACMAZF_19405 [Psychrobium sp. nBUS_13]|uniref:hypothetical protein n=1 Tax=Psychrobium sp. nBUS_13 TaxID=3395319 RepID=UPI003EBDF30B
MSGIRNTPDFEATVKGGLNFYFKDDNNEITVNCKMRGKESIYYNNRVVSNKYSFKKQSSHQFNEGGNLYEVEVKLDKLFASDIACTLIKNGAHLKTLNYDVKKAWDEELEKLEKKPTKTSLISLLGWTCGGFTIGFVISYLYRTGIL